MPSAVNTYAKIDLGGNVNTPKLIQDGLMIHLDAKNPKSYPGNPSNTTRRNSFVWYDLSKNGNHFYLYNTPTHNPSLGSFNFNGVDEYALDATAFTYNTNKSFIWNTFLNTNQYQLYTDPTTTDRTIEIWVRINNTLNQYANLFGWALNLTGHLIYYGGGKYVWAWDDSLQDGVAQVNYTVQVGEWIQLVCLLKPYFQFGYYVNGQLDKDFQPTNTLATANNNLYWYMADDSRFRLKLACDISILRMYNRILTPEEILNNYNCNKKRFGLR